jgi:hypothetical protein
MWGGVPAGCQWPKCRNRVGFDEPGGSTCRGFAGGRVASGLDAVFGKKGDDQLRVALATGPPTETAALSPWRTAVIGAVNTRAASTPSTGQRAARPASLIGRETSNSRPHPPHRNAYRGMENQVSSLTRSNSRRSSSVRSPATARSAVVPAGSRPGATSQRSMDRMMS